VDSPSGSRRVLDIFLRAAQSASSELELDHIASLVAHQSHDARETLARVIEERRRHLGSAHPQMTAEAGSPSRTVEHSAG